MRALLLLALLGCSTSAPQAPSVFVIPVNTPMLDEYLAGADAWEPLGFAPTTTDAGLPECGTDWWSTGLVDCQISIGIVRDPFLRAKQGTNAMADQMTRTITIDSSVTEKFALLDASAHEFGHLLLQTGTHTKTGIMSGETFVMNSDDYALACQTIHICVTP